LGNWKVPYLVMCLGTMSAFAATILIGILWGKPIVFLQSLLWALASGVLISPVLIPGWYRRQYRNEADAYVRAAVLAAGLGLMSIGALTAIAILAFLFASEFHSIVTIPQDIVRVAVFALSFQLVTSLASLLVAGAGWISLRNAGKSAG
jgi:hypothetical protein